MSLYILGQLKDYMHADMDYMQTYKQKILKDISQQVKYIYTDIPEQKDIEFYNKAGIGVEQIISMYQYFVEPFFLYFSNDVKDKLEELKSSLSYTSAIYLDTEIKLCKDGFVIASILLNKYDKNYFWGICYFSYTKLLRMEVYIGGVAYVNYYVTEKSPNGFYAKLVRRSFYYSKGVVAFDQVFEDKKERYLFHDGRSYTKSQLILEFVKRLNLSKQDIVLLDGSVNNELMRAVFTFGRAAQIIALIHTRQSLIKSENPFYYWFPYIEMLDIAVVGSVQQKEKLIQELEKYNCKIPDIKTISIDGEFTSAVFSESYNGNIALSWEFKGKVDGFWLYDQFDEENYEIKNMHQHYFLIKKHKDINVKERGEGYVLKAYVYTSKGKQMIAEIKPVQLHKKYNHPMVSLIIPAYNAEEYIVRTLDNALAQSLTELEIIVVDDGSTDSTPKIIDWYAQKYFNMKVIHQENKGVAAARNTGIIAACGEYVGFMDNDDMIHPDMMKRLYNSAKKNECDVAVTSVYRINKNGYEKFIQYPLEEDIAITSEEYFNKGCLLWVVIWNKIYRTSLVKSHLIPALVADDNAWSPCILSYADKICYLNDFLYEWDRTIRDRTQVDDWTEKSEEDYFNDFVKTVIFYLENGNSKK